MDIVHCRVLRSTCFENESLILHFSVVHIKLLSQTSVGVLHVGCLWVFYVTVSEHEIILRVNDGVEELPPHTVKRKKIYCLISEHWNL